MSTSYETPGCLNLRIDEYKDFRQVRGAALGTMRNVDRTLRRFTAVNGNLLMRNITDKHVTEYLTVAGKTRPKSISIDINVLNGFFDWGRKTKRIPAGQDPMVGTHAPSPDRKERPRLPVSRFPELLDAVPHPRDRVVLAMGLYLFLRQSELADIRLADLYLDDAKVKVRVKKKKKLFEDMMVINPALEVELRQWLTWYAKHGLAGPLRPDYFLVPSKIGARFARDPDSGLFTPKRIQVDNLNPAEPIKQMERIAKRALHAIGFDDGNDLLGQGIHTLRRSGARAWFDHLQQMEPFVDDESGELVKAPNYPIRPVQTALHHSHQHTTELYLGLIPDKLERDMLMRRTMFEFNRRNVVKLEARDARP